MVLVRLLCHAGQLFCLRFRGFFFFFPFLPLTLLALKQEPSSFYYFINLSDTQLIIR